MPAVERVCEAAGADAAPKCLASGSPKIAILFLPRHLAQSRAPFTVVLAASRQMALAILMPAPGFDSRPITRSSREHFASIR